MAMMLVRPDDFEEPRRCILHSQFLV
ncbi:uncharacterized protein G2W53_029058 [Senna tora]|uniref:Uncharacterized protein n=1 Tax=Senna tora TaxID=362788 RepID=A0A834WFD4_9FABA|nr:uncharacterized protein G2W53_029058 [Senna tora]